MKNYMNLIMSFFAVSVIGCSSAQIQDYKDEKPTLILEEYLNGTIDAYGIFQDRTGLVKKRFHCLIKAHWQNGIGTLDESFTYSDGSTSKRIWTIKKQANGQYNGTADDVDGEAIGIVAGNALQWKYTLKLEVDKSVYHVKFDDWMFLMDQKIMLNKSEMSKFGFHLGTVTLTFIKRTGS